MVDIHCHILPGIDDGSKDMATSINMLKNAQECKTKAIIATPHYYRGYFEEAFDEVLQSVESLKRGIKDENIDVEIYPGQEIFMDNHTVEMYRSGVIKGLNNTRYLLLETPMEKFSQSYIDSIYELKLLGAVPVIAHPERYGYIIDDVNVINNFIEEGCLFQINTGSITGLFGRSVQKTAKKLIDNGLCNFIASDAHTDCRRCTGLLNALDIVKKINNACAVEVQINGELLLQDEKIKRNFEKISARKSFFDFLK